MPKTKIAIFDFTGCEGCEFQLLALNEQLLDFFQDFDVVHWRLLAEKGNTDCDVAIVEGAATTDEDVKLLKQIRDTSKVVVAIGACAVNGNVFGQVLAEKRPELAAKIYGPNYQLKAKFLKPIHDIIAVDKEIPGCPPDMELFKQYIATLKAKPQPSKVEEVSLPDYTCKIEGHGILKINFSQKKLNLTLKRVSDSSKGWSLASRTPKLLLSRPASVASVPLPITSVRGSPLKMRCTWTSRKKQSYCGKSCWRRKLSKAISCTFSFWCYLIMRALKVPSNFPKNIRPSFIPCWR